MFNDQAYGRLQDIHIETTSGVLLWHGGGDDVEKDHILCD